MKITKNKVSKVKKQKILAVTKLILLATMLVLLFFIADGFVNFLVTIEIEMLKKAVYVILATVVVGIFTGGSKQEKEEE